MAKGRIKAGQEVLGGPPTQLITVAYTEPDGELCVSYQRKDVVNLMAMVFLFGKHPAVSLLLRFRYSVILILFIPLFYLVF